MSLYRDGVWSALVLIYSNFSVKKLEIGVEIDIRKWKKLEES